MNFSLLDHIDEVCRGVLVTILTTEGHTYKKRGAKALFSLDTTSPVYGNLGSLCVDQEIVLQAIDACSTRRPRVITIDTREIEDIHFGYGTYCGGSMDLLIEPILEAHKTVYRRVRTHLEGSGTIYLIHNLQDGTLQLSTNSTIERRNVFVEALDAPSPLCLFGATPLAHSLVTLLREMPFRPNVYDWRREYLEGFARIPHVMVHEDAAAFDDNWFVLILSHNYERDMEVLFEALSKKCPFIGLLSSSKRRDSMFEALAGRGISRQALRQVHSPVGLDLGGRSDPEIAVSIAAQLVRFKNDDCRNPSSGRPKRALRLG